MGSQPGGWDAALQKQEQERAVKASEEAQAEAEEKAEAAAEPAVKQKAAEEARQPAAAAAAQPENPVNEPSETTTNDACDAFAYYLQKSNNGAAGMDRKTTVEQINVELKDKPAPDARITDALDVMNRLQDKSAEAWVMGADMFAAACMDLGWEA